MAHALYFTLHADSLRTSGCATIVFWQIGVLETIVYNLKPTADFANLNVVIVYSCCRMPVTNWIILDNKSDFQNGAAQAIKIFHSPCSFIQKNLGKVHERVQFNLPSNHLKTYSNMLIILGPRPPTKLFRLLAQI